MGRKSGPRYRADRDIWYSTIDGTRHVLARGESSRKEAEREFHRIMSDRGRAGAVAKSEATVREVCNRYLDYADLHLAATTYGNYKRHLTSLGKAHGDLPASGLRPHHVLDWSTATGAWNPSTRAAAIAAVKRAFSWAASVGHIAVDPIRSVKKPRALRREAIPDNGQVDRILAAIVDAAFREFVFALRESGCRPGEVMGVTAAMFDRDAGTWTVKNKTRHKGDPTRTVYLTPALAELSARLAKARPTGPLFLNSRGKPWARAAIVCRFIRIRRRLGMGPEVTAYSLRHLFVTDALERGVPIATVAELVGHKGTAMISLVYSRLSERTGHLREAASRARRRDDQDPKP